MSTWEQIATSLQSAADKLDATVATLTGPAGKDGKDGKDGVDGKDGRDGAGVSAFLDVDAKFGGGWTGVLAAVREAETSGGPSAVVQLGRGYDATGPVNFTRPVTFQGGGTRGTRIRHAPGYTGPVLTADNLKRSGEWESTVGTGPIGTYNAANDDGGLTLRDFSIVDDDRNTPGRHGIYLLDVDDALIDNVQLGFLTGTALKLGADDADAARPGVSSGRVRESDFRRVRIYRCGSGSPTGSPDVPALVLQNGNDSGDGTNQNFFHQLRFVYNEGRMLIRGAGNGGNSLRRTIFRDTQIHALADNAKWQPSSYFPFDLVTLEGAVRETLFDGLTINGNRAGTYCFRMRGHALNGETPKRLVIRNANLVNVRGGFVRVDKGDSVMVDGTGLGATAEKLLSAAADSGLARWHVHEYGVNVPDAADFDLPAGAVGTAMAHGRVVHSTG